MSFVFVISCSCVSLWSYIFEGDRLSVTGTNKLLTSRCPSNMCFAIACNVMGFMWGTSMMVTDALLRIVGHAICHQYCDEVVENIYTLLAFISRYIAILGYSFIKVLFILKLTQTIETVQMSKYQIICHNRILKWFSSLNCRKIFFRKCDSITSAQSAR